MLLPQRIRIRGFRGFRDEAEFRFDSPATLLFGENRSGKSSTLNAIEWCLFGEECLGRQTGIRERIGWIIPNRHIDPVDVFVELEMANDVDRWLVRRSLSRRGRRAPAEQLELVCPDGECLTGPNADHRLAQLAGAGFRDFLTTVYQHQEAIRAILVEEPKGRNDAIDRLLGLSLYRNLLDAVNEVGATKRQKEMRQKFEAFERQVQTALTTRSNDLKELRQEAIEAGIGEGNQTLAAALAHAAAITKALDHFARDAGLAPRPLNTPVRQNDLLPFVSAATAAIAWFRTELPAAREQQHFFGKQQQLLGLKANLEQALQAQDSITRILQNLDAQHGGQQAVNNRLAAIQQTIQEEETRLRQTSARAALVKEARKFSQTRNATDACPLCGQAAPDLSEALDREWEIELQTSVGAIEARVGQLKLEEKDLANTRDRYGVLDGQMQNAGKVLDECRRAIGTFLSRDLGPMDDALAVLGVEIQAIEERIRQLKDAIRERLEHFREVEGRLEQIRHVHAILRAEEKLQALERIHASPAFHALEKSRDEMAFWVADLERVRDAIAATSRDEAELRLQSAEQAIDRYFRDLTRHPAVSGIRLRLEKTANQRNAYEITDAEGQDLVPILSQGDLNALALAIFLGLAAVGAETAAFGFVMLDDPSQSLGTEHKRRLVKVLNDVLSCKRIVVATMDRELRGLLAEGLTRAKVEYAFNPWTQDQGPTVTRR